MVQNKQLIFASHPTGFPIPGTDLKLTTTELDINSPPPGGLIIAPKYVGYDPYMRGRMRPAGALYISGFQLNEPLYNFAISTVISSSCPRFKPGDILLGSAHFAQYQVIEKEKAEKSEADGGFDILQNPLGLDLMVFLGPLGMSGLTAYSSFYEIGKPKKGEVIFISAASGAVGQVVGQLAKREGMVVIGSAGSDEKVKFVVEELGFDKGFNYKTEKPGEALKRVLGELGKDGLNIYYDNVGGETLDAALGVMSTFGRIVSCGSVSQTSKKPEDTYGIKNMPMVTGKRLTIRGFIVFDPDFGPKYHDEHQKNVQKWIKDGEIQVKLSVTEGIDNAAGGFVGMLKGENFGKALVKI
ncbi:NADP-dependent leukotriene B4 12-hydroxydehydrogenase [Mollisia scopiformis]|uniref:NADP-dependent leukotriene B4 12-hydroxydehydrogenase n=1 Tax=Mollisia scopiformis TaxID=149040 RepID=A0A194WWH3_MOLSC|nr:NADP-dependent leukotriene B4 12-hydroxydehydrogenase [Mollisia scopiformis]KUJ12326.1 NADP-dependent leukotriene B4 12-hydroxydehydrogenase [Mollisia scopiformis]